jgi:hypothetical protein
MLCSRARMLAVLLGGAATASGCHAYDGSLLSSQRSYGQKSASERSDSGAVVDAMDAAASDASSVSPPRTWDGSEDAPDSSPIVPGSESDASVLTRDAAVDEAGSNAGAGGEAGGGGAGSGGMAGGSSTQAGAAAVGGTPVVAVACTDAGAQVWETNGHCYFPLSVMNSWFVSRDRCRELGAHLVSISSPAEQAFVNGLVGTGPRWTGLSRFGAPAFSWVDGESVTYENWEEGAPNQKTEAAVAVRNGTFLWFDDGVSQAYAAICERQ